MSTSVPPDTATWAEAVTHGFYGERTDPLPDSIYVPGIQVDPDLAPTVTSLSPATGPEAGGIEVVIYGTLLFAPIVTVGGATATVMTQTEDGEAIAITLPAGVAGTADVTVTTAGGTVTAPAAFTYEAAPPPPE